MYARAQSSHQSRNLTILKTFRYNVVVHWGDTDPAKIVFYPNYFIWFDESTRLFWDSVGLDWDSLGKRYNVLGLPIVEAQAKFCRRQVPRRDRVEPITHRNAKTFKISHAVLNKGQRIEGYEIASGGATSEDPGRLKAMPTRRGQGGVR
jgi:4-hydroxybenzoyl-CoA thioesterase